MLHHRLEVLLDTRETDVLNFELDKQKIKHSSKGVALSCHGKDYLLASRGTDVDPTQLPYPESTSIGNKECIECRHLQFISNDGHSLCGIPSTRTEKRVTM
ncbi:hypothetical protein AVEN_268257-1 [Araneus ventricosus]|uniref:Uncharacterized protein n=1 Tax=Araneus ventricosus TaxID=182803 RepID=A0A4Y2C3G2_ARAVE|nr:hypothetical protein AVEN_268257-1 [Araneus ventricosus]